MKALIQRLKKILQSNYLVLIVALLSIIYTVYIIKNNIYKTYYSDTNRCVVGYITKINIDGNKINLLIKAKEKIIVRYYAKNVNELNKIKKYKLGDYIKINGEFTKPNTNTNFNLFNYRNYLFSQKIYWIINSSKIKKVSNNKNIIYKIKNDILNRINKCYKSKNYLNTFILGDNTSLDSNIKSGYQANGISHLFSISGMHVGIISAILLFMLKKVIKNKIINNFILSLFLIFYMILTNLSASIVRATIFFIVLKITKKLNIKTINLFIIFLFIMLVINPYNIYNSAFLFSYSITLYLILLSKKIQNKNSYMSKLLYISFISFLVSFPIVVNNYFSVNFLSLFNNLIFVPFISMLVFPLAIITLFIPALDSLLYFFINIMENISIYLYNINFLTLTLAKTNLLIIVIYYILITLFLIKDKKIYLLSIIVMILIHTNYNYFKNELYVTFLDVGQGDCILISLPRNSSNILIDTGGIIKYKEDSWKEKRNNYSISTNTIIPYLKSVGIKNINYLILTHGDYDHMGEAVNLVNDFKVNKVIFNCGEFNNLENKLVEVLKKKNIKYYSCIKELNLDKYKLKFLDTSIYDDENTSSSVIYLNYNNYKFLFMGDASVDREKNILKKYNLSSINFLKVGHHGSNTSSSKEFIDKINPKYSLISVGKNNRYGHPKDTVLDILKNSKIYRTDIAGSIEIKITKNSYKIRTGSS